MAKYLDRIQIDPKIMLGKPVITGTRIPVHTVLDLLAQGYDIKRILKAYPALKEEDITAALAFAARRFDREELHLHA
ncbi:MAG: DUF433 domain-containing protein [Patescibacteria group bacterium]